MKETLAMMLSFLKNPKEVGSITPSSRYLTNEIIKNIDFKNSRNFIELGHGLGTFTKEILKKSDSNSKLVCFEVNKEFCSYLDKNHADSRLIVINAGAESIIMNLKKLHIRKADCVISGLPFRNFSAAKKKKILAQVKNCLNKNGSFVLFQYTDTLEKMLGSYFNSIKRTMVPLNIPPCFVYACSNQQRKNGKEQAKKTQ